MNPEEFNQLIRMAQVLRVRAANLSRDVARIKDHGPEQAKKLEDAAELCRDIQSKLEQVRAFYA